MILSPILAPVAALLLSASVIAVASQLIWPPERTAQLGKELWNPALVPLGGVAVVVSFAVVGWFFGTSAWLMAAALPLCVVGLVDDTVSLAPRTRLMCEIPLALLVAAWVQIPPLLPVGLQQLAVAFWILTAINSFNLIDGVDGLAAGLGIITTFAVALIAITHQNFAEALTALALCGALSGLLIYNFSPAAMCLGGVGSLPVGFLLGLMCLDAVRYAHESKLAILATPALLMAVPIIDTSIVTVTRLATGRAISNRGLDHCHHRLHKLGLSQRRVAFTLWVLGGVGAAWAVFISLAWKPVIFTVLPLCALMFATIGLFLANLSFEHEPPGRVYGTVPRLGRLILSLAYERRAVEFALDFLVISSAYYGALLINYDFQLSWPTVTHFSRDLPLTCSAAYAALLICGTYRHMWRYAGVETALRFAAAAGLAGSLTAASLRVAGLWIPAAMLVIFTIALFNLLVWTRMSFRILRTVLNYFGASARKVLVVGAGSIGESAAWELLRAGPQHLGLVGFLDDDIFKHSKLVHGHRVLGGVPDIARVYRETGFNEIVIAEDEIGHIDLQTLQSFASDHDIPIHRYLAGIDCLASPQPPDGGGDARAAPRLILDRVSSSG